MNISIKFAHIYYYTRLIDPDQQTGKKEQEKKRKC